MQQHKGREEWNPTTEMSETALVPYLQPVTNNGQCNGSRRQLQLACSKELHHKNPTQHQNKQPLQQRGETEHGAGRLLQARINTMIDNRRRCVNYYYDCCNSTGRKLQQKKTQQPKMEEDHLHWQSI